MSHQDDDKPKYSPNESLTPGYSWRSSNIPKRITHARPTFVPEPSRRPRSRALPTALVLILLASGVAFIGIKKGPQARKAMRSIVNMIP